MNIKIILILIALICAAALCHKIPSVVSEDWANAITRTKTKCLEIWNVSEEEVDNLHVTWDIPHSLKCFVRCVYEKDNALNTDGDFILEELMKYNGMSNKIIEICQYRVEELSKDSCERPFMFAKCVVEHVEKELTTNS